MVSTPSEIEKFLPEIVASVGAFLPLLIFTVVSDEFKNRATLGFCLCGVSVWWFYFPSRYVAEAFGYTRILTFASLSAALISLLLLLCWQNLHSSIVAGADGASGAPAFDRTKFDGWLKQKDGKGMLRRIASLTGYKGLVYVMYLAILAFLTLSSTNMTGARRAAVIRFEARENDKKSIKTVSLLGANDAKLGDCPVHVSWFHDGFFIVVPKEIWGSVDRLEPHDSLGKLPAGLPKIEKSSLISTRLQTEQEETYFYDLAENAGSN